MNIIIVSSRDSINSITDQIDTTDSNLIIVESKKLIITRQRVIDFEDVDSIITEITEAILKVVVRVVVLYHNSYLRYRQKINPVLFYLDYDDY